MMGAKILVVDDSDTIQTAVQLTLGKENVELIPARNAEEAIQKAREIGPALMLIDTVMPDRSGYEVCRALRTEPALHDVPIIMLASLSDLADTSEREAAGASDVIVKPFEAQELIAKVRRHLDTRSQPHSGTTGFRLELEPLIEPVQGPALDMTKPLVLEGVGGFAGPPASPATTSSSTDQRVPTLVLEAPSKIPEPAIAPTSVDLSPHMIEQVVTRAAEQAFAQASRTLEDMLRERIEQAVRDVVPSLAEHLILKEIEQIKASINETTAE